MRSVEEIFQEINDSLIAEGHIQCPQCESYGHHPKDFEDGLCPDCEEMNRHDRWDRELKQRLAKGESLIEYTCKACRYITSLWTDEAMHSCPECLEWSLDTEGTVIRRGDY